jgi:hypothetical protein
MAFGHFFLCNTIFYAATYLSKTRLRFLFRTVGKSEILLAALFDTVKLIVKKRYKNLNSGLIIPRKCEI